MTSDKQRAYRDRKRGGPPRAPAGPTFSSVTAEWAKINPPYSGVYKIAVVHCDGREVLR